MQGLILWLDELTCLELRNLKKKVSFPFFLRKIRLYLSPKIPCFSVPHKARLCCEDWVLSWARQPPITRMHSKANPPTIFPLHFSNDSMSYRNGVWFHLGTSTLLLTSNWLTWSRAFPKPDSHAWSLPSWFYPRRHLFVHLHSLVMLLVINLVYYDFSMNSIFPFFLPSPFNDGTNAINGH